jgi:hypothetical protein
MVQYEFRTYFRVVQVRETAQLVTNPPKDFARSNEAFLNIFQTSFQLKHLTGSTADTYLEYVQRNLPEGVAMKVITVRWLEFFLNK